jgi:hypothetical protein
MVKIKSNQIKSNNCSCSSSSNHISQKQQLLLWSVESQAPEQSAVEVMRRAHLLLLRPVRLAYQPPASSTFLSEQTSHQQPASSTLLSGQTSTSHQPPANLGWVERALTTEALTAAVQILSSSFPSLPLFSLS